MVKKDRVQRRLAALARQSPNMTWCCMWDTVYHGVYASAVFSVCSAAVRSALWLLVRRFLTEVEPKLTETLTDVATYSIYAMFGLDGILVLMSLLLIWGNYTESKWLILPWLVHILLYMFSECTFAMFFLVIVVDRKLWLTYVADKNHWFQGVIMGFLLVAIVRTTLNLYGFFCVLTRFQEIYRNPRRRYSEYLAERIYDIQPGQWDSTSSGRRPSTGRQGVFTISDGVQKGESVKKKTKKKTQAQNGQVTRGNGGKNGGAAARRRTDRETGRAKRDNAAAQNPVDEKAIQRKKREASTREKRGRTSQRRNIDGRGYDERSSRPRRKLPQNTYEKRGRPNRYNADSGRTRGRDRRGYTRYPDDGYSYNDRDDHYAIPNGRPKGALNRAYMDETGSRELDVYRYEPDGRSHSRTSRYEQAYQDREGYGREDRSSWNRTNQHDVPWA